MSWFLGRQTEQTGCAHDPSVWRGELDLGLLEVLEEPSPFPTLWLIKSQG